MPTPSHENRTPEEIVDYGRAFDPAWHFWQALSWIDYAKRKTNIAALQYAALELRFGIEHLWFEIIIVAMGGKLDKDEYSRCKGNSTKMYKILDRLSPDHAKLVRFSKIAASLDPHAPQLVEWDIGRLRRLHGEASRYLHFLGHPAESTDSSRWFVKALTLLENGANSCGMILLRHDSGNSGFPLCRLKLKTHGRVSGMASSAKTTSEEGFSLPNPCCADGGEMPKQTIEPTAGRW